MSDPLAEFRTQNPVGYGVGYSTSGTLDEERIAARIAVLEDRIEDLGDEKNRLTAERDRYKAAIEEGFYCQICGAANFASIDEEV